MAIPQARGITTGRGVPRRSEGQNGDITIRTTRQGTKLYAKESNKWHTIDLDVDSISMFQDITSLKEDVRKLQLKAKNTPIVDKILLKPTHRYIYLNGNKRDLKEMVSKLNTI